MKYQVILGAFLSAVLLSACSSSNDVASNKLIQKRKYRQGFHTNVIAKIKAKIDRTRADDLESDTPLNELDSAIAFASDENFKWWESAVASKEAASQRFEAESEPLTKKVEKSKFDRPIIRRMAGADKHDSVLSNKLRQKAIAASSTDDPHKDGIISLLIAGAILLFGLGLPLINIVAACFGLYYGIRAKNGGETDLGLAGILANSLMIFLSLLYTIVIVFYVLLWLVSIGGILI